jgi:hypothetical protein
MLTREDFQQAIQDALDQYPSVNALYKVGDPRVRHHLDAMATMLSMYSAQIETAMSEPFEKVRDATVLADACMRGLTPRAEPARGRLAIANGGTVALRLEIGRELRDSMGRPWRLEAPVEIAPGSEVVADVAQWEAVTTEHRVNGSAPFYAIPIERAKNGAEVSAITVEDDQGLYEWRDRYTNTWPDERIYHVESDERRQIYVRFGFDGVVGVQPREGQTLTITILYALGRLEDLRLGMPFSLASQRTPHEARVSMALRDVVHTGTRPHSMSLLRELAKYPSVYNHNAVFLGEFEFLIRRHFPSLRFLSVWNEGIEERWRGMSLDNINALFIACLGETGAEPTLVQAPAGPDVAPERIAEAGWTPTQRAIREVIARADDSYRVYFYTPVRAPLPVTVEVSVPSSYDAGQVREQIRDAVIERYGERAVSLSRGQNVPLYQPLYRLLRERVPALSVGQSDLRLQIDAGSSVARPELWRYVTDDSLQIGIVESNVCVPSFGAGWGGV